MVDTVEESAQNGVYKKRPFMCSLLDPSKCFFTSSIQYIEIYSLLTSLSLGLLTATLLKLILISYLIPLKVYFL